MKIQALLLGAILCCFTFPLKIFSNNYISQNTYSDSTLLPERYLNFNANQKDDYSVNIFWTIQIELTIKYYVLERSSNGTKFIPIDTLKVLNNGKYNITDFNADVKNNFYRLKMIGTNEDVNYSNVILIRMKKLYNVKIFPNPILESISISLNSAKDELVVAEINDNMGKSIKKSMHSLNKGNNKLALNNLGNLTHGIYWLQLKQEDGEIIFAQKIVK